MAVFKIEGEEVIEKVVGRGKFSGQIYIHKKYVGRPVKIVILSHNGDEKVGGVQGVQRVQGKQGEKGDEAFA